MSFAQHGQIRQHRRLATGRRLATVLAASVLVLIATARCRRESGQGAGTAATPAGTAPAGTGTVSAAVVPPAAPRPVPPDLEALRREARSLRERRDHAEAAKVLSQLLGALETRWGAESPDLVPYADFLVTSLWLSGRYEDFEAVLSEARRRWPESLELRVREATARAEAALRDEVIDPQADALFAAILVEANWPRLRGMKAPPEMLFAQWAEMLLRGQAPPRALEVASRGLDLDPQNLRCLNTKARALRALHRASEARPILEALVAERPAPDLEAHLGTALLDEGRPREALARLEPLLRALAQEKSADPSSLALLQSVRRAVARALEAVERTRESAEVALELLASAPYDGVALLVLARCARRLGAPESADAIHRRIRELLVREDILRAAVRARAARDETTGLFHDALAALAVARVRSALEHLDAARRRAPRWVALHLERGRVWEAVGDRRAAEEAFGEGLRQTGSAIFVLETARLRAARGEGAEARRLLAEAQAAAGRAPRRAGEPGGAGAPASSWLAREARLIAAGSARVHLELGEVSTAREALREHPPADDDPDEIVLARAELAVNDRRLGDASVLLARNFEESTLSGAWARALRTLVDVNERCDPSSPRALGEELLSGLDPSDFLDHPRLLRVDLYAPGGTPGAERWAGWCRALLEAAGGDRGVLVALDAASAADRVARWRELIEVYRRCGARRKAREAAWFLAGLEGAGAEGCVRLAAVLDRPEEVVERLSVIEEGLRREPSDPSLLAWKAEARRALGLESK